jgi:hypothetical protein
LKGEQVFMKSVSLHHQNNLKSTGSTSFLQHNLS